uniref:WD_REPEATS_REGION domain-containing protein n=1 Tax=Glossina austeni TaxID=7395 RepID=A0A1A9VKW4_GLOAU
MNSERNVDPYVEGYLVGHNKPVTPVLFGQDGRAIATSSTDSTVVLWDLKSPIRRLRFSEHAKRVNGISWSAKSNFMASCSRHGVVNVLAKLAAASNDKSVKLWQIGQKKFITSFASQRGLVHSAKFSPNGQLVASLRIFDMKSGERVWCLTEEKGLWRQPAWHPNGNTVALALTCRRVKVFDLVAQELVQLYQVHSEPVNDLAFYSSGKFYPHWKRL